MVFHVDVIISLAAKVLFVDKHGRFAFSTLRTLSAIKVPAAVVKVQELPCVVGRPSIEEF